MVCLSPELFLSAYLFARLKTGNQHFCGYRSQLKSFILGPGNRYKYPLKMHWKADKVKKLCIQVLPLLS